MNIEYSIDQFYKDIEQLASKIMEKYEAIYAIPRGGIPVGMELARIMQIPLVDKLPSLPNGAVLVVDDIIDSGMTRQKYIDFPFACLHIKKHVDLKSMGKIYYAHVINSWISYWWERCDNNSTIEDNITRILELIGENPLRRGLIADCTDPQSKSTPQRVASMYKEFFCGYDLARKPRIMTVPNGEDGIVYNQMIRDDGYFFSFCEHHMIPFFGDYYFGYIPDKLIIGASKIGRIVDYYAGRLQVAERLVNQVVQEIEETAQPLGQVLVMNARHFCKEMRGLKKWNSPYEVIAVRGCFEQNVNGCKNEFMSRIIKKTSG